eukprot:10044660-Alexandrium_andersonii.AAC.1
MPGPARARAPGLSPRVAAPGGPSAGLQLLAPPTWTSSLIHRPQWGPLHLGQQRHVELVAPRASA